MGAGLLDIEILLEVVELRENRLFWKERPLNWFPSLRACRAWNGRFAGREAFTHLNADGYFAGRIFNKMYPAHRVIWAIQYGCWPTGDIDHVNGLRSDNRIENLRDVSRYQNNKNKVHEKPGESGHVGVSWDAKTRKWRARVWTGGQETNLGYFRSLGAAVEAREAALPVHGYHPNHASAACS